MHAGVPSRRSPVKPTRRPRCAKLAPEILHRRRAANQICPRVLGLSVQPSSSLSCNTKRMAVSERQLRLSVNSVVPRCPLCLSGETRSVLLGAEPPTFILPFSIHFYFTLSFPPPQKCAFRVWASCANPLGRMHNPISWFYTHCARQRRQLRPKLSKG